MNFHDTGIDLIILGNARYTTLSTVSIENQLKTEIISKAFPSGSRWRLYTGVRSIAFFPLQTIKDKFAIIYSIVIKTVDMPIISFATIIDEYRSKLILSHGLRGIENSFLRKLGIFVEVNIQSANVLKENIISYKLSTDHKVSKNIVRQSKRNQTIFTSSYTSPSQWLEIEALIVNNSFSSKHTKLSSFRSFTLNQENDFEFLGLVQE